MLARRRLPEGLAGITMLHELVAEHLDPAADPDQVLVGVANRLVGIPQTEVLAGQVEQGNQQASNRGDDPATKPCCDAPGNDRKAVAAAWPAPGR